MRQPQVRNCDCSIAAKGINASVAKTASTSVDETGNDLANQATIGETITYTYSATIPAGTTVYSGELWDELPPGISLLSIDNADLEALAAACAAESRWAFQFVCAPLVIPRGTGSPVNPLAIL